MILVCCVSFAWKLSYAFGCIGMYMFVQLHVYMYIFICIYVCDKKNDCLASYWSKIFSKHIANRLLLKFTHVHVYVTKDAYYA